MQPSSFLYHSRSLQYLLFILFLHIFRSLDPDLAAEAKDPVEEYISNSNFRYNAEILLIAGIGLDVGPKAVNDSVHHAIVADKLNLFRTK